MGSNPVQANLDAFTTPLKQPVEKRPRDKLSPENGISPEHKMPKSLQSLDGVSEADADGIENRDRADEKELGAENNTPTIEMDETNGVQNEPVVILHPVLAYMWFGLQSGTKDQVKNAVLGFYTKSQIFNAKKVLWDRVGIDVIGRMYARKTTNTKKEEESNATDIINALYELDKADRMPVLGVPATELNSFPRSNPRELNSISIVDRLSKLEEKIGCIENKTVRNTLDISEMKANSEKTKKLVTGNGEVTNRESSWANMQVEEWKDSAWDLSDNHKEMPKEMSYAMSVGSKPSESAAQSPRASAIRGGRGGRGGGRGAAKVPFNTLGIPHQSVLRLRGSNCSLNSKDSEDFTVVTNKKGKKRNVIIGNKTNCEIKGAPEPNRDLFIFRLDSDTTDTSLRKYITEKGITVRELELKSNAEAKFKSYRLSVPKTQFAKLLDGDMWPEGVGVRKFFVPPKQ